jgi:CubicO group peptidase (beta-lactamase class C family)
MLTRSPPLIPMLLLAAILSGCSDHAQTAAPPPLSHAALAAVGQDSGAPREQLARAIDDLFADQKSGETRALVIMHDGRIVAERYAPGFGRNTRMTGWSVSKCVTGVLIGLLVADGRLRLNESAPVPLWQRPGDPRGEITLKQLLQMRSGLRHTETADPVYASDTVRMLYLDGRDDMAAYAEAQPLEAEPGRRFEYSTATSIILDDIAARAITNNRDPAIRRQAVSEYLRTRLLDPAGMRSMVAGYDPAGTLIGASFIYATARDWAKLGEFLRNGGAVRGAQLAPRSWIDFMVSPSPRNPAYGAQLWLNRPDPGGKQHLFPGKAPASLFACIGHVGQYVIVSPRQHLTLVRLGHTRDEDREQLREHLGDIVALFPRS